MVLGKHSVPGRHTNLENSRARAYCACSRCGGGFVWTYFSLVYLFYCLSPSLGDDPILTEILSQRTVKPKTTNLPNPVVSGMKPPVYSCYQVYSIVSDKNAYPIINSDLTTHSAILYSILRRFVIEQLSEGKTGNSFSVSSPQRFLFPLNLTRCPASLQFVNRPCSVVDAILFFSNGTFDVIT